MLFESFPENSKVWVYTADRFLTEEEKSFIQNKLTEFLSQWKTHGSELYADAAILHDSFIVISVDESKVPSSGCSIDSSVRFVKTLGQDLNIDFFNRLSVVIVKDGQMKRIHYNDIANYPEWNLFNPIITNLSEFRNSWLIPVVNF